MERKSILLVEDDPVIRDTTQSILEIKFHVLAASNYSEALDALRKPMDLAIVDYRLPDQDGIDLLKEIRKIKPNLPIIMMTGYSSESTVIEALRAGATDYIKKPLSIPYLLDKVSELLGMGTEGWTADNIKFFKYKTPDNRDEFIIESIAKYAEEKYREDLSLEKISDIPLINKNKFALLFKKKFGMSFSSYLQKIRLKKAAELLKNPDIKITEIVHFVGFGSAMHFNRTFKEEYGITPREYRKKLEEEE